MSAGHITREELTLLEKKVRADLGSRLKGSHIYDEYLSSNMHYYWCPITGDKGVSELQAKEQLGYTKFKLPKGATISNPELTDKEGHLYCKLDNETKGILLEIPLHTWTAIEQLRAQIISPEKNPGVDASLIAGDDVTTSTIKGPGGSVVEKIIDSPNIQIK